MLRLNDDSRAFELVGERKFRSIFINSRKQMKYAEVIFYILFRIELSLLFEIITLSRICKKRMSKQELLKR